MNATANSNLIDRRIQYVLDTDTVSAHQRARPNITARLAGIDRNLVASTVITISEQCRGRLATIARVRDDRALRAAYEALQETQQYFCTMRVLPFDEVAIGIYRRLVAQRIRIGTQDLRIAAITLTHNATVITSNRRDFDACPVSESKTGSPAEEVSDDRAARRQGGPDHGRRQRHRTGLCAALR